MSQFFCKLAFLFLWLISLSLSSQSLKFGNQILRDSGYSDLIGRKVAILSNPTGVFADTLVHIVDDAFASKNVTVVAILSPEHGFRGDHQAETGDPTIYVDEATRLPVLSAYELSPEELSSALKKLSVDCVLVDLQDAGVRLYTFVWTMYNVMQTVAMMQQEQELYPLRVVIADRPNPLGGELVDGPLLNLTCCVSGYGRAPITHIHGMTIGELALLFNDFFLGSSPSLHIEDLIIVCIEGWNRSWTWADLSITSEDNSFWIPPSPNLPTFISNAAYGATAFIEATTIAEGRGTTTPFTLFGAPFVNATLLFSALSRAMSSPALSISPFRAAYFEPTYSKYNFTDCAGVQWMRQIVPSFKNAISILTTLRDTSPVGSFQWDGSWFGHPGTELIDQYMGTPEVRRLIDAGEAAEYITAAFEPDSEAFKKTREPYLLYS
jgi:uncharacterized protein YbbC (DUF1343 family)